MNKIYKYILLCVFLIAINVNAQTVWNFTSDMEGWHDLGDGRDVTAVWEAGKLKMIYSEKSPGQGPQLWFSAVQVDNLNFDAANFRYLELAYQANNWPTTSPVKFLITLIKADDQRIYSYADIDPTKNFVSIDIAASDPGWGAVYSGTIKSIQLELPHNGASQANPATNWFNSTTLIDKIELTNTQTVPGSTNQIWNFDTDIEGWTALAGDADIDLSYETGNLVVGYSDHGAANLALNSQRIVKKNLAIDANRIQKLKMDFTANWPTTSVEVPILLYYTVDAGLGYSYFKINPSTGTFTIDIRENDPKWGVPFQGTISKLEIDLPHNSEPSANIATNWFTGSNIKIDKIELIDYSSTGVKNTLNESISIYPNPASTSFNVLGADADKVSIFNVAGMLIKNVSNTNQNISVEGLQKGLYFVEIVSNGTSTTKKVVVK